MGRVIDNKLTAAFLPLLPVVLAGLFKFSVIDKVVGSPIDHLFDNYVVGAWIEIISISFVSAIAWGYASYGLERNLTRELAVIIALPLVALVVCVILKLGAPKMNAANNLVTVYLPLLLSFASLAYSSVMIREVSKNAG